MLEWVKAESLIAPWRCISCQNTKDLWDTHSEVPGFGRVYLCPVCIRMGARKEGLSRGKQMDRLVNADALLAQAEKERDQYQTERDEAAESNRLLNLRVEEQLEEIAQLSGRVKQLEARIAEEARAALSLVSGGDEAA